jgi:hypothetical protein
MIARLDPGTNHQFENRQSTTNQQSKIAKSLMYVDFAGKEIE